MVHIRKQFVPMQCHKDTLPHSAIVPRFTVVLTGGELLLRPDIDRQAFGQTSGRCGTIASRRSATTHGHGDCHYRKTL